MRQVMRPLPTLTSIQDVLDLIAVTIVCADAEPDYVPPNGWHTIRVDNAGDTPDPHALRTFVRLFDLYGENRHGALYWKDVLHFDREKREIAARFCIDHRQQ